MDESQKVTIKKLSLNQKKSTKINFIKLRKWKGTTTCIKNQMSGFLTTPNLRVFQGVK